ncbi:unnamed protein product [Amoebophrya sp. A120]|nr:unnamed protein product [Amoebophrya sp. A120]|eukprot:GSA120T00017333001.1
MRTDESLVVPFHLSTHILFFTLCVVYCRYLLAVHLARVVCPDSCRARASGSACAFVATKMTTSPLTRKAAVRAIPGKGMGVVALDWISAGEIVLARETPLLHIRVPDDDTSDEESSSTASSSDAETDAGGEDECERHRGPQRSRRISYRRTRTSTTHHDHPDNDVSSSTAPTSDKKRRGPFAKPGDLVRTREAVERAYRDQILNVQQIEPHLPDHAEGAVSSFEARAGPRVVGKLDKLLALSSSCSSSDDCSATGERRVLVAPQTDEETSLERLSSSAAAAAAAEVVVQRLVEIVQSNGFAGVGSGAFGSSAGCSGPSTGSRKMQEKLVFEYRSRFNHSCVANAFPCQREPFGRPEASTWEDETVVDPTLIRAARDVAPGEEITLPYIWAELYPLQKRQALLKQQWGFDCECALCGRQRQEQRDHSAMAVEGVVEVDRAAQRGLNIAASASILEARTLAVRNNSDDRTPIQQLLWNLCAGPLSKHGQYELLCALAREIESLPVFSEFADQEGSGGTMRGYKTQDVEPVASGTDTLRGELFRWSNFRESLRRGFALSKLFAAQEGQLQEKQPARHVQEQMRAPRLDQKASLASSCRAARKFALPLPSVTATSSLPANEALIGEEGRLRFEQEQLWAQHVCFWARRLVSYIQCYHPDSDFFHSQEMDGYRDALAFYDGVVLGPLATHDEAHHSDSKINI